MAKTFGDDLVVHDMHGHVARPKFEMSDRIQKQVDAMQTKLILMAKSPHTVKTYTSEILSFFKAFELREINDLSKAEIEQYMYTMKDQYSISDSKQKQVINAIKF